MSDGEGEDSAGLAAPPTRGSPATIATSDTTTRLRTLMAASFGLAASPRPERALVRGVPRHPDAGGHGDRTVHTPALARMSAVTASGAKCCSSAPQQAKM